MNVMAKAHKITRETVNASPVKLSYRSLFVAALKDCHKMNKQEMLKAQTIAQFEQRIEELKIILNGPDALKYMVVVGDEHPMPVNFESVKLWSNIETATKWNSRQFAEANAAKVVNGNNQVGKAVRVDHHIEWDMQNLSKLINDLNTL